MSGFKIGKPRELPKELNRHAYVEIWAAAEKLENGLSLPIDFDTVAEAMSFASSGASKAKGRGLRINRSGSTAYISKNVPA